MRKDGRLSRMLHVLIHMHLRGGHATSETIALMLNTSPVVVRRTMAGLREHGYVTSEGGHGGGWWLNRELADITLLDIHCALGEPTFFAIEATVDHPGCPIERAACAALNNALQEAEGVLRRRMGAMTLAEIARDFLPLSGSPHLSPSAGKP